MATTTRPPIPKRWFEVYSHKGDGAWYVATAGGNPAQVHAQAKGVRDRNGIAVIVSVRRHVTKTFRTKARPEPTKQVRKKARRLTREKPAATIPIAE